MLFLSFEGSSHPPFDAAALHRGAWDRLNAALRGLGHDAVDRAELEPLVRQERVRTNLSVSAQFLSALSLAGVDRLLVADLTLHGDRILLKTRQTDTATGDVRCVSMAEERLDDRLFEKDEPDTSGWLDRIEAASREVVTQCLKSDSSAEAGGMPEIGSPGGDLYLLPLRRKGINGPTANLITYCILHSLLETPWRIEDPGVTFSRLRDQGVDPANPDRRARPELADSSHSGTLLFCDVVAYDEAGTRPSDAGSAFLDEEAADRPSATFPEAVLSLRLVHGESGAVLFSATEQLLTPRSRGLFGITRNHALERTIQPLTDRLVQAASQKE